MGRRSEARLRALSRQGPALYFRADAGFANPEVYEYLESEGIKYAIRLWANRILQERITNLLKRAIGRPSNDAWRSFANFTYQAGSWSKPRRVIAKVEWHPGELYPRVGIFGRSARRWPAATPIYKVRRYTQLAKTRQ